MDRRQALALLGKGVCGVLAVEMAGGCSPVGDASSTTVVNLEDVPDGGRLEIDHHGDPLELRRAGSTVEARSLWCTHFGCVVQWDAASREYLCPCHDGRFDARGRPIAGPPTTSLRTIPVRVTGHTVSVGKGAQT